MACEVRALLGAQPMKINKAQQTALAAGALTVGAALISRGLRAIRRISFRDRSVLITGGSRGLGLQMARQFGVEGARVLLAARDQAELDRARDDLRDRGVDASTFACDITDRAQAERLVEHIVARYGAIDVLINNAGIIQVGPLDHMQPRDFEEAMAVHFWAPLHTMLAAIPHMRRQGGGRIVNISSIGGKIGVPHLAPYGASKFALTGFSDAIRAELARDNIHVTTVALGLMRTGSHVNAQFKGKHDAEFAWFSASAGAPLISMDANRAARKILAACRRGQPSLTLTFAARGAIVGNALFPNLTGYLMKIINRFLPDTAGV